MVLPTDVSIDPSAYTQLQALSPINIDDNSFKQLSSSEAQVYATVGPDQKAWTLQLVWRNDRWILSDSIEGKQDAAVPTDTSAAASPSSPVQETPSSATVQQTNLARPSVLPERQPPAS